MKFTVKNGLKITIPTFPHDCTFVTFEKNDKIYTIDTKLMTSAEDTNQVFKDFVAKFELPIFENEVYDKEYQLDFGNISIHFGNEGDYARLVENGKDIEIESLYWTADEFAEDPTLVLGALLGAALHHLNSDKYIEDILEG